MGETVVRDADDTDCERWNGFLASTEGTFYQAYEWRELNREELRHETWFLMAERDGDIEGVLPLVRVRSRLFGDIVCSMPFVNYGGVCARSESARSALVAEARRRAEEATCDYLEIRAREELPGMASRSDKVTMRLPLDTDPDVVWRSFKSKHRNNVNRVQREGVEVESGGELLVPAFYRLLSASWSDMGTPLYRESYFRALMNLFGDRARIFLAYQGGRPIAGALNGYFNGVVEGMWAAMLPEARKLQPNYVLYWEMIRHGCIEGLPWYHLGRSTRDSPAAAWKARWGAEAIPLYWNYHLVGRSSVPELNPRNPKYRAAIAAWRRLPLAFTRAMGPPLARLIP